MNLAIVILNWNGKDLLEKFLPSVIEHSPQGHIYVADNASTDDSIPYLRAKFPSVKIIKNQVNGGFASGYNDALAHIETDIYCLLNNDVEVTHNWLQPIMDAFDKEPQTAIIQPKILDYKAKEKFEYAGAAGGFIDAYGFPYCRGRIFNSIEKDEGQYDDISHIFWASGACLFIRKKVFEDLKGFDRSFFAHMEEIDLCWRAANLGYQTKYYGNSKVYHVGGATLSTTNPKKTYLNFRNSLLMLVKNLPGSTLFPILFLRLLQDGLAGFHFLITGKPKHFWAVIRSHLSFFSHLVQKIRARTPSKKTKKYYGTKSIVWSYYIAKKRSFNRL